MMPRYDYRCERCGCDEEIFLKLSEFEIVQSCHDCGAAMRRVISPVLTIGPMPSKPYRLGGADVDISSNEELRKYEADNPTARIVDKDDSWMRKHRDEARERAETVARGQGFRDWRQRGEKMKAEKHKKKVLDG